MIKSLRKTVRKYFFPDMIVESVKDLDFDALKERGFRVILLDIDNTLVPHGTHTADRSALQIRDSIDSIGLSPVVCSNAKAERLKNFSGSLDIECISDAKKPAPHAIKDFMQRNNIKADEIIMIGDQLITDVLASRRAGIPVVLSKPISKKEIFYVRLKRPLEKLLVLIGGKDIYKALEEVTIDSL